MRSVLAALVALAGLPVLVIALLARAPFTLVAALRRRFAGRLQPHALPWQQLIEFDRQAGWKPRPQLAAHALDFNGDAYRLETDADGWRGAGDIGSADVIVFGDSFAFGCGIDERNFFANLAGPVRIKAIGAPGYNMVQSLYWIERTARQLSGKTIVWLIYPGNDLEDNIRPEMQGYRMPFVRTTASGSWEIVTHHLRPGPWPFPTRRTNYEGWVDICAGGFLADRVFSACDFLIRRAAGICRAAGVHLVVMTVPDLSAMNLKLIERERAASSRTDRYDVRLPDRRLADIACSLGVAFVSLADHLRPADYLRNDVHWNARGHRRVADLLAKLRAPSRPVLVTDERRSSAGIGTRPVRQQPTVA